jgi:hypothetical protein
VRTLEQEEVVVARQLYSKHVSEAKIKHTIVEELLEVVFFPIQSPPSLYNKDSSSKLHECHNNSQSRETLKYGHEFCWRGPSSV